MLDNATNNNIVITAIIKEFDFNLIKCILYYLGHIINIISHYLLYGYNLDLFKAENIVPILRGLIGVLRWTCKWARYIDRYNK